MIDIELFQKRRDKLVSRMQAKGLDAFLVLIPENRYYLSGFSAEDTGCMESAGALLIFWDKNILATDSRFTLQAENEARGFEVICYKNGLAAPLPDLLEQTKCRNLGFEADLMSFGLYSDIKKNIDERGLSVKLVETTGMIEEIRAVKSEWEIEKIKDACRVSERAFLEFLSRFSEGMTEKEAAWEIEKAIRESGADALSFPVIAAFGENSALPHAVPQSRRLKPGNPLLFDWGARLCGYCSDATRTLFFGKPDTRFTEVFNAVYDAHMKAVEAVRPGMTTRQIDKIARDLLSKKGFGDFFGHGLGHGVGLAVHESPSLSPVLKREIRIMENMVFTIEPGVYIPGWGGVRLENMVVVRKHGAELLNTLDLRLMVQ